MNVAELRAKLRLQRRALEKLREAHHELGIAKMFVEQQLKDVLDGKHVDAADETGVGNFELTTAAKLAELASLGYCAAHAAGKAA